MSIAARAVKQCKQKVKGPGAIKKVTADEVKKPRPPREVSAEIERLLALEIKEPSMPVVCAEIERLLALAGSPQPLYANGQHVFVRIMVEHGKQIYQIRNKTQGEVMQVTRGAFGNRFMLAGHVLERLMYEGYSKQQLSLLKIAMLENPP